VWDSPNSAGVIIDALRCAKIGLDRKIGGALLSPSSYFMKTPPIQYTDEAAHIKVEDFISGKFARKSPLAQCQGAFSNPSRRVEG
jgi:myo-inositol-1-phosphate synthase